MERGQHYFAQEEFEEGQDVFEKVHHELKKRCKALLKISLGQRKTNRTLKKMMDKKKRKNLELEKAHEAAKEKAMEDKVEFTAVLQLEEISKEELAALEEYKQWETEFYDLAYRLWELAGRAMANQASCLEKLSDYTEAIEIYEGSLEHLLVYKKKMTNSHIKRCELYLLNTHINRIEDAFDVATTLFEEKRYLGAYRNFELCRGYAKEAMKCAIKLKLYKDYFKLFHEFSF